ncbi:MAG: glycosyltransferase family 4 protein [Clostridia bacterium]|nr:glycosyltransferase family 4 protein [Clostridia bacterium]
MNVLFLTTGSFNSIDERGIYTDLLRHFNAQGHGVFVVCPNEKRNGKPTQLILDNGANILRVKTGNITKCNLIEKGISTLKIEGQFIRAIKKYFKAVKFDLVLYSTPPITFYKAVKFIKKRDGAKSYLLLKDIFPQNAVDIGVLKKSGLKGIIYKFFRKKEKKLYAISDKIGCMSKANCDFILKHNSEVPNEKVEICPNSVDYKDLRVDNTTRLIMREKYNLPLDKKIFIYGGNLGRPQGVSFICDCLKECSDLDAFFLIVGSGTEYGVLEKFMLENSPSNAMLMKFLPKEDYDKLVSASDIGMIFLDYRFTIPNFPSRLLSYMQAGLPVLSCTDPNTDIGQVIVNGGFGASCFSNDIIKFKTTVENLLSSNLTDMGNNAVTYLKDNYLTANSYEKIMALFSGEL